MTTSLSVYVIATGLARRFERLGEVAAPALASNVISKRLETLAGSIADLIVPLATETTG